VAPLTADVLRFNGLPAQIGPLTDGTGVAGGVGSFKMNGPTGLLTQPFKVTVMLSNVPAVRLPIINVPVGDERPVPDCGVPFFV
jgi:hypothetical protein